MFKFFVMGLFSLFIFNLYADNGNISTDVKSEASSANINMTRDSNIQAMSGGNVNSTGATTDTQKSFYEYGNDKNKDDKRFTEHERASTANLGAQEESKSLAWEATRNKQKVEDGEYSLDKESKDIAVGGMSDGEHSMKLGETTSLGSKDGTYDIGN